MNSKLVLKLLTECAEGRDVDLKTFSSIFKEAFLDVIRSKYGDVADKYFDVLIDIENEDLHVFHFKEIVANSEKNITFDKIKLSDARKIEPDFCVGETCTVEFNFDEFTREDINKLRENINTYIRKRKALLVYEKYSKLKDKIVNVSVYQFCRDHVLLHDENNYELILPLKETISNEKFRRKQFVKVAIKDVFYKEYGTIVVTSRIIPVFLRRLLEYEIPEIADGIIDIKQIVRVAGVRSKVILESFNINIDPVSTCVGVKGSTINAISRNLNGEYIDFIQYSDDFELYLVRVFGVPSIRKIKVLKDGIFVYIDKEYIGLAIGKDGINIKLVRMLLNKHVDVFAYSEELDSDDVLPIEELAGSIDDWVISSIKESGFDTLEAILNVTKEEFEKKTDFEVETIDKIYKLSEKLLSNR